MSWVTSSTVLPCSRRTRSSRSSSSARVCASTDANGSSISSSDGCEASARAIDTRCCMPPESCHGYLPAASASPTHSSASIARARRAPRPETLVRNGNSTLPRTDSHGNSDRL